MLNWKESLFAFAGLFRGFAVIALFVHGYHLLKHMIAPSLSLISFLCFNVIELVFRLPEMLHMNNLPAIFQCALFLGLYVILTLFYTVLFYRLRKTPHHN